MFNERWVFFFFPLPFLNEMLQKWLLNRKRKADHFMFCDSAFTEPVWAEGIVTWQGRNFCGQPWGRVCTHASCRSHGLSHPPACSICILFYLWKMLHTADITLWLSSSAYLRGNSRMSFRKKYFSKARILNGPRDIEVFLDPKSWVIWPSG